MGLAAATILLKSQAMVPGDRVVVAGCGPLLAAKAKALTIGMKFCPCGDARAHAYVHISFFSLRNDTRDGCP